MIRDTAAQDTPIGTMPGHRLRRIALLATLILALLAGVTAMLFAWRGSSASVNASRLRMAPASVGTLVRDASVNGRVVAAVSPSIYATAAGSVVLKVNAGDPVRRGQLLAIVESPDLAEQLKREQSNLEQLEAEVARQEILARKQKLIARRDADQAEIELVSAQRAVERIEGAYQAGVIAKVDYLKAQDTLRSAEVRSRHADQAATLESEDVSFELRTKQSQLQRQRLALVNAQRRFNELVLRSPVDGVVGTLSVATGSVVAANAPLMTLVDLSRLEVELDLPETYVADLGLGMHVEIQVGDIKAQGSLSALSPEVVKNQVLARARFDGVQPPGMRQSQRVSARILIEEKHDVLLLPRGPFVENEGGRFAYVVEDGIAVRRPITLGATSVSAVEIRTGLKAGELVVIAGTDTFANAARVAINN